MKGIILAAGFGIRLESITMHKPKSMIKVCGKPILEYQLDAYQEAGVDEIIIVTGYKSNVIENYIQENGYENVKIIKNNDYQNTNNMYSLWLCRDILLASEQTFISNADVIFDKSVVKRISNYLCDYIVCDKGSYNDESMKITLNSNGFVNDISKTINENNSFGSSIDLYFLTNKTANALVSKMDEIIEKEKNQWTEIALQSLLKTETVNMLPFCLIKIFSQKG